MKDEAAGRARLRPSRGGPRCYASPGIMTRMASHPPTAPPALDYAARPPNCRLLRRARRLWPAWLLVTVAGVGIAYGPWIGARYRLLKLQQACAAAEMSRDRPVYEADAAAAEALAARWPEEYSLNAYGRTVRTEPRWTAFADAAGLPPPPPSCRPPEDMGVLFLHELHTPDGRRRIVAMDGWANTTVVEPAGLVGGPPRLKWRGWVDISKVQVLLDAASEDLGWSYRLDAGTPDPADRSRFVVPLVHHGVRWWVDCKLGDDDVVAARLRDADAFERRVVDAIVEKRLSALRAAPR